MIIEDKITFGTDGWRGKIADSFTIENLKRVSQAAAKVLPTQPECFKRVVIGWDRRFLSETFAQIVAKEFLRYGWDTRISSRSMTTPAVSVCVKAQNASWGVMITASHNPALYNGFKVKESAGRSATPAITLQIEQAISKAQSREPISLTAQPFDFWPDYQAYLASKLNLNLLRKSRGTVILDCLHGVASGIPERLIGKTRLNLISLHTTSDPLFGGLHPEPIDSQLGYLKKEIKKRKALLGLAFDGDADRLGVVDDTGTYLPPHVVFPLLTWYFLEHKKLKGKIVQSISMGALGERIAKAYGLPYEEVPVGFKHIADRILQEDVVAGGEESGGFAFSGTLPERDGILNGLMFLEMVLSTEKKPSQLVRELFKRFGQVYFDRKDFTLQAPVQSKESFVSEILNHLPSQILGSPVQTTRSYDGIKIVLADDSWILLRPSGTEPLLRVYAESDSRKRTQQLLEEGQSLVMQSKSACIAGESF